MKRPKRKEIKCPACEGTGLSKVTQPVQPGRKIYPPPCDQCSGKGRIELQPEGTDLSPAFVSPNASSFLSFQTPAQRAGSTPA